MTKTIPLAEAKKSLSAIIKDVDEKAGLLETLDLLSGREELEAVARAKAQVRAGRTVSLKEFKARVGVK